MKTAPDTPTEESYAFVKAAMSLGLSNSYVVTGPADAVETTLPRLRLGEWVKVRLEDVNLVLSDDKVAANAVLFMPGAVEIMAFSGAYKIAGTMRKALGGAYNISYFDGCVAFSKKVPIPDLSSNRPE